MFIEKKIIHKLYLLLCRYRNSATYYSLKAAQLHKLTYNRSDSIMHYLNTIVGTPLHAIKKCAGSMTTEGVDCTRLSN